MEGLVLNHILVAYGGRHDDELVRMACRVARETRANVSVLHVVEVPMSFALDAHDAPGLREAAELIEHCERVAGETGIQVNADSLAARDAGCALAEHAMSTGADVVYVGTGLRRSIGRGTLKATPEFVLANACCSVVLARFPRNGS